MAHQSRQPPHSPQRIDTLRILIERSSKDEENYYRANLQHSGVTFIVGGKMKQPEQFMVQANRIQELRHAFEQQVATMHAWAAEGLHNVATNIQPLAELGHEVSKVLPASIQQGIAHAVQHTRNRQHRLYITLEVAAEARAVLALPWELLCLPTGPDTTDSEQAEFLLLDGKISLTRQVRGVGRNTPPRLMLPLNLHAFAASPRSVPSIDLEPTRQALEQATDTDLIAQRWFTEAETLTHMQQRLAADQPQIVHIICHGHQQTTGRDIRNDLLLTWQDGLLHRVNAFTLATVCSLDPALQLVILQACHAGAADLVESLDRNTTDDANEMQRRVSEGIALTLIRRGVPVVVAMQGAVGQAAAGAFVQAMYTTLSRGSSVEEAVANGRLRMFTTGGIADWSLPVIYQGSGLPPTTMWPERLADRFAAAVFDPAMSGRLRSLGVLLALLLLFVGIIRLLFGVPGSPPTPDVLILPLAVWTIMGVLCPLIIGATYRGARDRDDLPSAVRRGAIIGQWIGAFLGYALGGLVGLGTLAVAWMLGLMPWAVWLLGPVALLWSVFASYAGTHSQRQSARAISEVDASLFDLPSATLIIGAMLLLILSPWLLLIPTANEWAFLLSPAASALSLSLLLLMMILLWKR